MKVRITDLLDQYEEDRVSLSPVQDAQVGFENEKETIPVKQSKRRFGWKEGLAVAAAAAVVVLGGFGVSRLVKRGEDPVPATNNPESSTVAMTEPTGTEDTSVSLELTEELRRKANLFLTPFAEQGITKLCPKEADVYDLVSFAHLYYKINQRDAIVYQEMDGGSYETLTIDQVNSLLQQLMGREVDVAEGTDFTAQRGDNYAQHEIYKDGTFWFPAADGDPHTAFAVCEGIRNNSDGTLTLEYRVYDLAHPEENEFEDKAAACANLTVQLADKDEQFVLVMCGAAIVRTDPEQSDSFRLLDLNASWVDESQHTDPALDGKEPLQSEETRLALNSLLSRLAEQNVTSLSELKEDEGALLRFAHQTLMLHGAPAMGELKNGTEYEVMYLSDLNQALETIFNLQLDPEEGTEYPDPHHSDAAPAFVRNSKVWFPAGQRESYPCFAVCTKAVEVSGPKWELEFNVYETTLETFETEKIRDYYNLTAEEAETMAGQKVFYLVAKGKATVEPVAGGIVLDYERTWVEPEGWEEEWPPEYPVSEYRIEGDGFLQSGMIRTYHYEQLPEAEGYVDILTEIARQALQDPDASFEIDSPHDGYANWFMTTSAGGASVSGSDITGRFTYNLGLGFDRILEQSQAEITDRAAMEQAARDFVAHFTGITGELELIGSRDEEQHYHDERFSGLRDVVVPTVIYSFRSAENSSQRVELQDGLTVPVTCGDSSVDDLADHVFTVQVWPDGTVITGNNYISRAKIVSDGTMEAPDEGCMEEMLSFTTSFTEDDTFVLESAAIEECSVYFGYGTIDPILTVNYHFASDPGEHYSTKIAIEGLLN